MSSVKALMAAQPGLAGLRTAAERALELSWAQITERWRARVRAYGAAGGYATVSTLRLDVRIPSMFPHFAYGYSIVPISRKGR